MRALRAMVLALGLVVPPARPAEPEGTLRFAWPVRGDATIELSDERSVGDERRSVVIEMHLRVEPDSTSDRLVLRFSDARIVSVDNVPIASVNPAGMRIAVARVMRIATPTILVDRDGRYAESRDLDGVARGVLAAAGFPGMPPGLDSFKNLLRDVASGDWYAWVGAWLGSRQKPGEWTRTESAWELDGTRVPVKATRRGLSSSGAAGRTRLEAAAVYPSESVRRYTGGFLIDMAREARELGDGDTVASTRFLEHAQFSPVTETLTVDLETATMRPILAERTRTFSAVARGHWVSGSERRAHRFTWSPGSEPR